MDETWDVAALKTDMELRKDRKGDMEQVATVQKSTEIKTATEQEGAVGIHIALFRRQVVLHGSMMSDLAAMVVSVKLMTMIPPPQT